MFWKKNKPPGTAVSPQHWMMTNTVTIEALINILIEKNVCTRQEVLDEIKRVARQLNVPPHTQD